MAMDASPLAKLPPDLRNMVYHEVLCQKDPIILLFNELGETEEIPKVRLQLPEIIDDSSFPSPSGDDEIDGWRHAYLWEYTPRGRLEKIEWMRNMMGLTATCRALRQETRDLFFAINPFRIEVTILHGEFPQFSKDTASDSVESFLKHLSTQSAISAVNSITLDLGFVWLWPKDSTPLLDMVTGLNQEFLKRHPGLPLKLKAICCFYGLCIGDRVHVYIDMQNLAASIELALEQLERWHEEELETRHFQDDRELCQAEFDNITSQLEACLQQNAATEEV
ncbi:hypothetical protein KC340_g12516 [Hortaea werneckii]|nr:hypothetical protein KC339_g14041 [Hortaea werneckii]KAI7222747.1 hypothetical protein KC365_g11324 [Hortaea werneckii]KAI7303317.1 hypothetical protein KC340_g12516 [Hortaea werneckii]KAI7405025.1 hypothetical protein KC328_g1681 [Hortaea werneckii]KAI7466204.1 hypothetical protein KC351_g14623 [Hortaea werneckii]